MSVSLLIRLLRRHHFFLLGAWLWLSAATHVHAQAAGPATAAGQAKPTASAKVEGVAAAQPSAPTKPPIVRAYGTLWATSWATQPVQSYGYATATAPTSAANPGLYAHPDKTLLTFQVQQTRAGLVVGEGTPVRGTLEVDFIHFDQSSPLAQAFPRIRAALIEWQIVQTQRVFAGQTWDIFGDATGALLSHSFNLVGTLFQAGNIGFMRQQFGWTGRFGALELSLAAGLQGANTGPSSNNIEEARVPTGAGRIMLHLPGTLGVIGVSSIVRETDHAEAATPARTRSAS